MFDLANGPRKWWGYLGAGMVGLSCFWLVMAPAVIGTHIHGHSYKTESTVYFAIFVLMIIAGSVLAIRGGVLKAVGMIPDNEGNFN